MIKEGDILICHTTCEHAKDFICGEKYTIGYVSLERKLIGIKSGQYMTDECLFDLTDGKFFYKKWFIKLAEWRDEQINSILDDE